MYKNKIHTRDVHFVFQSQNANALRKREEQISRGAMPAAMFHTNIYNLWGAHSLIANATAYPQR